MKQITSYKYLLAFISLSLLIFISFTISAILVSKTDEYHKIINISGKQRMLSQKLVIETSSFLKNQNNETELINTLNEMKNSHKLLMSKDYTKKISYDFQTANFDTKINDYFLLFETILEKNDEKLFENILISSKDILIQLDKITKAYEYYAHNEISNINTLQFFFMALALGVIFYEASYIFKPMFRDINKQQTELIALNKKLKEELKENKKQQNMLIQQSKLAAMGEMIAMIAHQWRQPLTTLSTILIKLKTLKELNILSDEKFDDSFQKSQQVVKYLSDTIDDFRNFFKEDMNNEQIEIKDLIKKSKNLFENDLRNKNINLIIKFQDELEKKSILINSSKVTQVIMNLIKNAYDVLLEKDLEKKFININIYIKEEFLHISVEDNGGGILDEIKDKIFEPYFSTKSKNGTGLGLYMSKIIVEKHLNGILYVENSTYGAKFVIRLKKGLIL